MAPWRRSAAALREYPRFLRSWRAYQRLDGAERLQLGEGFPCLFDRTPTTPYDPHYVHQSVWTAERVQRLVPRRHVDVGSEITFVAMLSTVVPVVFVDIRPLHLELRQLSTLAGDLLRLPLDDASAVSLSCLHVAEHVGLGRYGDRLLPDGTQRACRELSRVLAPAGNLFFSVPVGRPRTCFNAHRIHEPARIVEYFGDLELVEFSLVDDSHDLVEHADPVLAAAATYGCGLFWFRRPD